MTFDLPLFHPGRVGQTGQAPAPSLSFESMDQGTMAPAPLPLPSLFFLFFSQTPFFFFFFFPRRLEDGRTVSFFFCLFGEVGFFLLPFLDSFFFFFFPQLVKRE